MEGATEYVVLTSRISLIFAPFFPMMAPAWMLGMASRIVTVAASGFGSVCACCCCDCGLALLMGGDGATAVGGSKGVANGDVSSRGGTREKWMDGRD